jgi:hypothetical protein
MMKKLFFCLFSTLLMWLLFACQSNKTEFVAHQFKAEFVGNYVDPGTPHTRRCPDRIHVNVVGEGKGTFIGQSILHADFCVAMPDTTLNHTAYGGPSDIFIIAENGDTLFIELSGKVIRGRQNDHPDHVISYWRDSFYIKGGTGKFADATGSGLTDDYNSILDSFSHHHWVGTISIPK